jgi:hypothetical protein
LPVTKFTSLRASGLVDVSRTLFLRQIRSHLVYTWYRACQAVDDGDSANTSFCYAPANEVSTQASTLDIRISVPLYICMYSVRRPSLIKGHLTFLLPTAASLDCATVASDWHVIRGRSMLFHLLGRFVAWEFGVRWLVGWLLLPSQHRRRRGVRCFLLPNRIPDHQFKQFELELREL